MKKISILCLLTLILLMALTGCANDGTENLKVGLGIDTVVKTTDATEEKNGNVEFTLTSASVIIDENGRIVKCSVDTADYTVAYTAEGKAAESGSLQTKYQQGDSYGMKIYGGAKKEWYEQADAFCAVAVGKTLDEIKALVADNGKGTDAVIQAGCTISVSEFVRAIETAVQNAK